MWDVGPSLRFRPFLLFFTHEMMLQRAVFWGGLLLNVQYASAAATWKTPTTGADLKANTQDSVWLDWTSDYPAPVLRMLCKDVANGGNLVTGSSLSICKSRLEWN